VSLNGVLLCYYYDIIENSTSSSSHNIHKVFGSNWLILLHAINLLVYEGDVYVAVLPLALHLLDLVKSRILNEVMMFMTLISRVRVDSLTEDTEEVSKEPLVHVSGHLVENKPVPQGTVLYIVLYMAVILILLEISSDLPLD